MNTNTLARKMEISFARTRSKTSQMAEETESVTTEVNMRIIKCLTQFIDEELGDAEKYAKKALELKEDYPELAESMFYLSGEELKHMTLLHNHAEKLISQLKDNPDPRTEGMKIAYELLHEQAIEKEKGVRILQGMFRG